MLSLRCSRRVRRNIERMQRLIDEYGEDPRGWLPRIYARRGKLTVVRNDWRKGECVMRKGHWMIFAATLVSIGLCPASRAQWAVVDVRAITQLVQEVADPAAAAENR